MGKDILCFLGIMALMVGFAATVLGIGALVFNFWDKFLVNNSPNDRIMSVPLTVLTFVGTAFLISWYSSIKERLKKC